jgi:hypothetical protein
LFKQPLPSIIIGAAERPAPSQATPKTGFEFPR